MNTPRALDATQTLHLTEGQAVRVAAGTVLVFVIPRSGVNRGRRIPVTQIQAPELVAGSDLRDADLLAVGLPGTQVESVDAAEPIDAVAQRIREVAQSRLAAAQDQAAVDADLQILQARHDDRLIDDALLGLAAAVPGDHSPVFAAGDVPDDAAVVDFMARQVGLNPYPLQLRRALADAEISGRDSITALASAAGAAVRQVHLAPGWWRREGAPVLLRRNDSGEYAAAVWRRGAYHVWQPSTGLLDALSADSAAQFARSGILFEPLLDPNSPARIIDLLRLGIRGSRSSISLVVAITVVVGLLAAVIPIVSGQLTETVASQTTSTLLIVGCALVAFAAGDMALRAVRSYALLRIRGRAVSMAATAVWDRLLRLPMRWHNERTVSSRMVDANAVDTASLVVSDAAITTLLDVAVVVGAIIGVFTASAPLAIALVCFLAVRAVVEIALVRRAARLTRELLDSSTISQSVTLDLITGVNRLRVSGATKRAFWLWAKNQAETTKAEVRQRRNSLWQQMSGALWPTLGLAVLLAVTAVIGADVGKLVTAQTALAAATTAVAAAVASVGAGLSARAVLRRAEAVLQTQPESGSGQEVAQLLGAVDVRDVVFAYRPDMPPVLRGVNLSIPAGAHVAIVGPSGCGKSTLLRLLLGLEEPDSGLVSFDGRDLSGLDRASVRRQIGTVMQSSQLMPGSIRDNVDLGRGVSVDDVWQALEDAAVADDIRAMPMGLATVVVEGAGTVSGGQRQRILLARALAGRPRILILDEATSALDNVSQAAIVASLDRLQITRVVVAHRLSTIQRADLVVMLADGIVVAAGTFDDLMQTPGPFRDLVARQAV